MAKQGAVQGTVGIAEVGLVENVEEFGSRAKAPRRSRGEVNHRIRLQVSPKGPPLSLFRVLNDGIISANSLGSDMLARWYPRGTAGSAASVAPKKLARALILIIGTLGLNFVGPGCHSQKSTDGPSLELTKIPPAAQGGRESIDTIARRVRNARPGQQIAIYGTAGRGTPGRLTSDRDGD
jgi:hypothetical protein